MVGQTQYKFVEGESLMSNVLSELALCVLTTGNGDKSVFYIAKWPTRVSGYDKLVRVCLLFLFWTSGTKYCELFECIASIMH